MEKSIDPGFSTGVGDDDGVMVRYVCIVEICDPRQKLRVSRFMGV